MATGDLTDILDTDTRLELLASGFSYTEGPAWDSGDEVLFFNDIPANSTYRLDRHGELELVAHPVNQANGMAFDREGRRLVCESGANRLVRYDDGSVAVLASHYDGKELNSPNDLAVRSNGDVYFTDPAYGRIPVYGQDRPAELSFQGVYRITAEGGELELLCDDFAQPNGICFSPDERRLYVDDTERASVWEFEVDGAGRLRDAGVLREPIGPALSFEDARSDRLPSGYVDGMKCDALGNVYVTGPEGIWVLRPDGSQLGVIELPEDIANFTWGGADGLSLFCCCRTFVGRLRMKVRGAAG